MKPWKKIALKSQVSQKLRRDEKENHRRKLAASRSARSKSKITEHRTSSVVANAWIYTNRELSEMTFFSDPDTPFLAEKETVTWIDIHGLHDEKFIVDLAKQFNLHALVIEDILTTDQLPKIESYCDFNHIVIKNFGFKANTNLLIWEQVSFILGPDFVISIQEGTSDLFSHIKALLENPKSRVREKKADYLLYVLLDVVVDNGYLILDKRGSKMEEVEDMLLTSMQPHSIQRIHAGARLGMGVPDGLGSLASHFGINCLVLPQKTLVLKDFPIKKQVLYGGPSFDTLYFSAEFLAVGFIFDRFKFNLAFDQAI